MDNVARVVRFPLAGETVMATAFAKSPGGKGANQAVAAARAGAKVSFVSAVGDDADGRALLEFLRENDVNCEGVRVVLAPTGMAQILVDATGENQIVVASGANAMIEAAIPDESRILLAQLEAPADAVQRFFKAGNAAATRILNAAPFHPHASSCIALADIVIVNETELAAYAGSRSMPQTPAAVADMVRELLAHERQRFVVTLGSAGSVAVAIDSVVVTGGVSADVVDTIGAGDCFCGYLAAGLSADNSLEQAITIAHHAAALSVGKAGAASSTPFMAEVHASMLRQPLPH